MDLDLKLKKVMMLERPKPLRSSRVRLPASARDRPDPLNFLAQIELAEEAAAVDVAAAAAADSCAANPGVADAAAKRMAQIDAAGVVWREAAEREVQLARASRQHELQSMPPATKRRPWHERRQETAAHEAVQKERRAEAERAWRKAALAELHAVRFQRRSALRARGAWRGMDDTEDGMVPHVLVSLAAAREEERAARVERRGVSNVPALRKGPFGRPPPAPPPAAVGRGGFSEKARHQAVVESAVAEGERQAEVQAKRSQREVTQRRVEEEEAAVQEVAEAARRWAVAEAAKANAESTASDAAARSKAAEEMRALIEGGATDTHPRLLVDAVSLWALLSRTHGARPGVAGVREVRLLRLTWVVERARRKLPLPRRQDLEELEAADAAAVESERSERQSRPSGGGADDPPASAFISMDDIQTLPTGFDGQLPLIVVASARVSETLSAGWLQANRTEPTPAPTSPPLPPPLPSPLSPSILRYRQIGKLRKDLFNVDLSGCLSPLQV